MAVSVLKLRCRQKKQWLHWTLVRRSGQCWPEQQLLRWWKQHSDQQRLADLRVRWRFQKLRLRGCWWLLPEHLHLGPWLEQQCCWPWYQFLEPEDLPEHWRFQKLLPLGCWWLLLEHSRCLDPLLGLWSWQKPSESDQLGCSVRLKLLPEHWRWHRLPERLRPCLTPDC